MLTLSENVTAFKQNTALSEVEHLDQDLYHHFKDKFHPDLSLSRSIVSFQANKTREVYRWYKFKEAFSAALVEYLIEKYNIVNGIILDPFAGSGTALFAAIEQPLKKSELRIPLNELRITKDAYPEQTKDEIEKYLVAGEQENERVQTVLRFALLCILESVSYTRKDGQYLRWDYRSGRRQGKKPFNKGTIPSFENAICNKIEEIIFDLQTRGKQKPLFTSKHSHGTINLYCGSCLDVLPTIPTGTYAAIITSPPYCNRYDYTRTYALELALQGISEQELANLRQQMLSCTVENRTKDLIKMNPQWTNAINAADHQELLQAILKYLDDQKAQGILNNNGIPRMVRGYFCEMACVIAECSRVMKPRALLFMVNDNVRYAGASISVDMILSNIAEKLGFHVENILILPTGKGNSSQQMGEYGRKLLRKCVYVWRKTE